MNKGTCWQLCLNNQKLDIPSLSLSMPLVLTNTTLILGSQSKVTNIKLSDNSLISPTTYVTGLTSYSVVN
jgi:hypothetical protein